MRIKVGHLRQIIREAIGSNLLSEGWRSAPIYEGNPVIDEFIAKVKALGVVGISDAELAEQFKSSATPVALLSSQLDTAGNPSLKPAENRLEDLIAEVVNNLEALQEIPMSSTAGMRPSAVNAAKAAHSASVLSSINKRGALAKKYGLPNAGGISNLVSAFTLLPALKELTYDQMIGLRDAFIDAHVTALEAASATSSPDPYSGVPGIGGTNVRYTGD